MEMATAMNRSVANVLFAGFGGTPSGGGGGATEERPHVSIGAQDAAIKLAYADSVVIVPGYGLAVAQAQHAIKGGRQRAGEARGDRQLRDPSRRRPHARHECPSRRGRRALRATQGDGRDQPGDAAHRRRRRPIAGMPIIEVDQAHQVIVIKRSLSPGFAGIDNDLVYEANTSMLFDDAKKAASDIAAEIQNL
jgi:NAD(P) transhydrogenase subunit beta